MEDPIQDQNLAAGSNSIASQSQNPQAQSVSEIDPNQVNQEAATTPVQAPEVPLESAAQPEIVPPVTQTVETAIPTDPIAAQASAPQEPSMSNQEAPAHEAMAAAMQNPQAQEAAPVAPNPNNIAEAQSTSAPAGFFKKNLKVIIIVAGIVILGVIGFFVYQSMNSSATPDITNFSAE